MKFSRLQNRGIWLAVISAVILVALSSCGLGLGGPVGWEYDETTGFWVVAPDGQFLCPNLVLADQLPPIDLAGAGEGSVPEDGAMPIGDVNPLKLAGPYDVDMEIPEGGDPHNHQNPVEAGGPFPDQLSVDISDSMIRITGSHPWVEVSGTLEADGSFVATGHGVVAGRSDVAVSFTGTLAGSTLAGAYEMGLEGRLPGGSITYSVNGQKALAPGTVTYEMFDAASGVSTRYLDLDGDGLADVVRTFDEDGVLIDEKELDGGRIVTFSHFDASTGIEWKWVDTNNDGVADVRRRYDRDGTLIEEQALSGTTTSIHFDAQSGITTELVDTDGDGRPDVERRYNRNGSLMEERSLQAEGSGTVISEGYDAAAGVTTQWVDLDGDGQADLVRRRDADGNLVDERALDLGGVVTFSHFDASTGVEMRYVDTNGDGKPDVLRRYDRDGNLLNERGVTGTLYETDFNATTGVTTEWLDTDRDGRPDVIRTYDREGFLIEERNVTDDDTGQVIGQTVDQDTGATTYWVDTDADEQPDVELLCDSEGAFVSQSAVSAGLFASLTWLPICGGILFSIGVLATVLLTGASMWDWRWTGTERSDSVVQFREHLNGLEVYEIHTLLKQMEATIRQWEAGGDIVIIGRAEAIDLWQTARTLTGDGNKQAIIDYAIKGLVALLDHMKLVTFLAFYLDVITGLLGADFPGPLKFLKMLAKIKRWTKLIERIEAIEKIKDATDKIKQFEKLKEDLKAGEGELLEVSMVDPDPSAFAVKDPRSLIAVTRGFFAAPASTLRGCSPIVIIAGLLGILGFVVILVYVLFGDFLRSGGTSGVPFTEEPAEVVSVGDEGDVVEAAPTPHPTPTLSPLDFVLAFGDFSDEQKAQIAIAYMLDPSGDWIYSISQQIILKQLAQTDITGSLGVWLALTQTATGTWFNNSLFPCDTQIDGGLVICTESAEPMPEGRILMLVMQLDGEVPLQDPDHYYTYAAVLDADGNPSNNFQFQSPYDWDYFQGTDRWYSLDWNPVQGSWSLTVTDVARNQRGAPSKARAVIFGDVIVFFIPAEEFSVEQPGYRLTAFGHDGTYALENASGDVTGDNPTEALIIPLEGDVQIEE